MKSLCAVVYAALAARPADFSNAELAMVAGRDEESVRAALSALAAEKKAFALPGGCWLSDTAVERLERTARRALTTYHRKNPHRKAMPAVGLCASLVKAAGVRDFPGLVAFFEARGVLVREGAVDVRLPEHAVTMPSGWQAAAEAVLEACRRGGLQPPSPDALQRGYPRDVPVRTLLNILAEQGEVVRVSEDLFISAEAMERVKEAIRRLARAPGGVTVGAVRDAMGSSRRFVLPILEHLDACGLTRRQGDARVLNAPALPSSNGRPRDEGCPW